MARLDGADPRRLTAAENDVFAKQQEKWGATLGPYQIYARCPTIMHAVIGMWQGLSASGLLEEKLTALVNRRVAALNGCLF